MLLVNVNTKQFIPSAGSNFIQPVESRDQIIYGTRVEVRFQLYNPDGTVFALNESDVFCCAGDINFIHTDDLMFYSGHEMCRIIDAAQGIVGVTIDATSDSFADKATSQNTRMYVQLKRHVAGDTLGDTVLQDIVYAQPAVMTTEGAPASSDPEYMTAAATLALLRTAPDYQFSADGETDWHDQQDIAADRFYRERRNGGEWGPAIELIEGKTGPTGAAAGFATPSVTVETLPAGSDATASVATSGDNTAKVFNFNFGIPKGADGKNGTDGKAGADGADGVSSYTYVAYASDASGAGFSLTPTDALKFRAEIHTTTAIETPDAEDFVGATWIKYIGDDGAGTGDMLKSVYDTNDDGIVDHAAAADAVGTTTAAQVADAVGKAHTHANKATLDKLAEADGKLTYDGAEIGGSGTVKSVNGQLPDESGNVTVETGGAVDESRLLPETGSVSSDSVGNPVIFKAISRIDNTYWLCLPLNEDTNDRSTYDVATGVYGTVNIVSNAPSSPGGSAFFDGSSCLHGTLPAQFGTSDFTVRLWMMAPAISSGSSSHTIFSTRRGNQTDADTFALLCTTEGRLYIYSDGSITSYGTDTPFALQSGVWYHVAVVRKSGVLTIYVNGEVYNSATFTNSLTRQIFGIGASWTGSSYSEAGTVYLTSLDVLNYAAYDGAFTTPAYQPGILANTGYEVATDDEVKSMLSVAGIDESRLLPENPANGDIPCFDATATIGGGNDANTRILLHFDADEIKDEAAGNAAPVTITKKSGTITVVEGGKWGKCAKYVTGSMTVATNLDELNANNWVVSGWFNPDENNHGVSYPTWLSMDDQNTHGFGFDSTGRYGESDGPLFYLDTPPASGTWHWLAIVKYSGGLRFYLNGAFLNEISAQQRANFCSTLAIGGFAGTYAAGSTERTFSGLVDEVRLQYIPDDEITLWTGTSIAVPDAPYSKPQTVGEWGKLNKAELAMKSDLTTKADKTELLGKADKSQLANYQPLLPVERQLPAAIADDHLIMSEVTTSTITGANDDTVKFLLQPATSSNQVVDSAAGNTTPLEFTNNGVTADSDGVMTFSPTQYAVIPANTVSTGLIDILLNIPVVPDDNVKYVLFGSGPESNSGDGFYVVLQGGKLYFCPSDRAIMFLGNYTADTWVNIMLGYSGPTVNADRNLGYWLDGTGHTVNLNSYGSTDTSGYVYTYSPFGHAFYLGKTDMSSTGLTWKAKVVRLRNTVEAISWYPYNDTTTITVDDYPYQKTVQKVTKSWVRSTIAQLEAKMNVATASAAGLMAAADKVKLDALQQAATYINTATDFDTYKTAGSYFLKGAVHTNGPLTDSYAGTLVVVALAELQYVTQYFTQLYTNKTFVRTYAQDNSAWSAWRRIIVDTDLATTTVAGLMPAADKTALTTLEANYLNKHTGFSDADMNTALELGVFWGAFITNAPVSSSTSPYYALQNMPYGVHSGVVQLACQVAPNLLFYRYFDKQNASGTWRRLLTDADITEYRDRPGYFKLPNGTIVQWGAASNITADGNTQITFPVAFPNAFLIGNAIAVSGNASASGVVVSLAAVLSTGMTLLTKNHPGNGNDINVHWLAIGY